MVQPYPQDGDIDVATYARADADIEWLKAMVSAVRRIRSELGVSPSKQVSLLVRGGGADATARIARLDAQLRFLCRIERLETLDGEPPAAAPAVVGELPLFVPLEGLVDLAAERTRLDTELPKAPLETRTSEEKLAKFRDHVPQPVVATETQRRANWRDNIQTPPPQPPTK